MESVTVAGSRRSILKVCNGAKRISAEQRQPSFDMSQEFPLSSLKRSFPMRVSLGIFRFPRFGSSRLTVHVGFLSCPAPGQREPTFGASCEFPSSSPYRSFPMLVQFGHFSVPEIREQSFNRARWFSRLSGSWAAVADGHQYPLSGSPTS